MGIAFLFIFTQVYYINMASKYVFILLILFATGFLTLGVKKLLLLRSGFTGHKKQFNWFMLGLLILASVLMLSCNTKIGDTVTGDTAEAREPVVVTSSKNKATTVHKQVDGKGNVTATVTISTRTDNNEILTQEKVFSGTREEVDAQINKLGKK